MGKTTLVRKLIYDWSTRDTPTNHSQRDELPTNGSAAASVERFDWVFYIECSQLQMYDSLLACIHTELIPSDCIITMATLGRLMQASQLQSRSLFIIDGYDELTARHDSLELLIKGSI